MGKLISKFRNKSSAPSNPSSATIEKYSARSNEQNQTNNNKKMNSIGLKEGSNFEAFDNVLNINTAPGTLCLFGQSDYGWRGHEKDITKVLYCPKMDRYLSCSRDKTIKLWNLSNDRPEMNMVGHELVVTCIAMDSENNYLISGSRDNNLNLWDLRTGKLISNAHISRNLITDAYWSKDSSILIQSSEDKEVRIWDPFNLKVIHSFPKKQYIQSSCQISNDNYYAITTSNGFQGNGCEITVWDLRKRAMLVEMFGHEQTVTSAKIIHNDSFVVSCSNDSTVRLWNFKNFKMMDSIYLGNTLTSIAESTSTNNLVVSSLSSGIFTLNL